tara:strand:+ start:593 stop:1270 length:678 start_codon:yes stop_codon:yes gene_type:complete
MHQLTDRKNKIFIYIIFLFLLTTVINKTEINQKKDSIYINKINVSGLSNANNQEIVNNLDNLFHQNIFFIKKDKINKIISKHTIIEKFNVKKIYPKKLNIEIVQTEFIAKISGNNQILVGSNGKLIANEKSNLMLPYIFGKFDTKKFIEFKKIIDYSKFNFNDFRSIFFFPSNRWDILTKNNILIKLPEKNFLDSLDLAYKVIKDDQFKNKSIIDLRNLNHLVIK